MSGRMRFRSDTVWCHSCRFDKCLYISCVRSCSLLSETFISSFLSAIASCGKMARSFFFLHMKTIAMWRNQGANCSHLILMGRFVFPRHNVLCKSGTEMKQTAAVQSPIIRPGASKRGWIGQKVAIWAACKWNHFILRVVISCAKPALMMRSDVAFIHVCELSQPVCLFPVVHTTIAKVKEKKQNRKQLFASKLLCPVKAGDR